MPCVEELSWIVADLSALKTSAPNASKQYSAPSDFGGAGIGPVAAATILSDFAKTSRSVKSFRGGQRRRCAICSPSLPLGCRIGPHPAYLSPVDPPKPGH